MSEFDPEFYVIGACLISESAFGKVRDILDAEDLANEKCRFIWRVMERLHLADKPIDSITVGEEIEGNEVGLEFSDLVTMGSSIPSAANVQAYAEIAKERSVLRQIADVGQKIADAALNSKMASSEILGAFTPILAKLNIGSSVSGLQPLKNTLQPFYHSLVERYESGELMLGRSTPWPEMNRRTRGLRGGELAIIAARPAMGKSVMGFGLAIHDGLQPDGKPAFFSLEMSRNEFVGRGVSSQGNVPNSWIRAPDKQASDSDLFWSGVVEGITSLKNANVYLDDTPGLTINQICARARREHARGKLSMVVVDHIHIVKKKGANPVIELGDISMELKNLAKELDIPVIALAQLNRGNTSRTDKRPTLSDIRDSGAVEENADYVFLIHREGYYDKSADQDLVQVIVGKGRNIEIEDINLRNSLKYMRFDDYPDYVPAYQEKPKKKGYDFS